MEGYGHECYETRAICRLAKVLGSQIKTYTYCIRFLSGSFTRPPIKKTLSYCCRRLGSWASLHRSALFSTQRLYRTKFPNLGVHLPVIMLAINRVASMTFVWAGSLVNGCTPSGAVRVPTLGRSCANGASTMISSVENYTYWWRWQRARASVRAA